MCRRDFKGMVMLIGDSAACASSAKGLGVARGQGH